MKMMRNGPTRNDIQDLFVDSRKNVWVVMGDSLLNTQNGNLIHLKKEWGCLQDLDTDGRQVYAFMDSGIVAVFRMISWSIPFLPILQPKLLIRIPS